MLDEVKILSILKEFAIDHLICMSSLSIEEIEVLKHLDEYELFQKVCKSLEQFLTDMNADKFDQLFHHGHALGVFMAAFHLGWMDKSLKIIDKKI
jgi:hypothetical protein